MPINIDWNATAYFPPQEPDRIEVTEEERYDLADDLFASVDKALKRRGILIHGGSTQEERVLEQILCIVAIVTTIRRQKGA